MGRRQVPFPPHERINNIKIGKSTLIGTARLRSQIGSMHGREGRPLPAAGLRRPRCSSWASCASPGAQGRAQPEHSTDKRTNIEQKITFRSIDLGRCAPSRTCVRAHLAHSERGASQTPRSETHYYITKYSEFYVFIDKVFFSKEPV